MKTISELRKDIYDYNRKYFSYLFTQWKWYSYRKLKMIICINTAPVLVYLCMKLGIPPNAVTVVYALMGVLGGVFLAFPVKWVVLVGILFFFFRPFLDWTDGLLARETKRTSITGDILDNYGAYAGWVPLWAGLGLYAAEKFASAGTLLSGASVATIFFCLAPVIPTLFAINILISVKIRFYDDLLIKSFREYLKRGNESTRIASEKNPDSTIQYSRIKKIFNSIDMIFEHNTRTVDLICLIILLELFLPFFISWAIFLAFLVWQIIYFIASFYLVARGGWAEKELKDKLEQINKDEPAS